jgi:hypothetical protein
MSVSSLLFLLFGVGKPQANINKANVSSGSYYKSSHLVYHFPAANISRSSSHHLTCTPANSVLLYTIVSQHAFLSPILHNRSLTSAITTPLHRNNRITLQPPRRRRRTSFPFQWFIARSSILNVQVLRCFPRLNGAADGEVVGACFWAEDRGGGRFGIGLQIEMVDWIANAADLADGGCAGG